VLERDLQGPLRLEDKLSVDHEVREKSASRCWKESPWTYQKKGRGEEKKNIDLHRRAKEISLRRQNQGLK